MHSAHYLMLIDICIKFCEYSLRGFQVIERTRFATDRRTDRQTPGENNMSPDPEGGRHNYRKLPGNNPDLNLLNINAYI